MNESAILDFMLVLCRVSAFVGFFPLFSRRQVPVIVKSGLSIALAIFWFDASPNMSLSNISTPIATVLLAKEVATGFFLALLIGFLLVPAKIAGAYIGQEVGLSLAAIASPGSTDQSTLVTIIFEALAVILFFTLNGHHLIVYGLHYSFAHGHDFLTTIMTTPDHLIGTTNRLFEQGLLILAPVGICLFVLIVLLSFLNRVSPTLNLFSIGMPVRSWLGFLCLVLFMPILIQTIAHFFSLSYTEIESMLVAVPSKTNPGTHP